MRSLLFFRRDHRLTAGLGIGLILTKASSASGTLWQTWHDREAFSRGLRTWWSETFMAPSRRYGMWQSAHETPALA